MLNRARIYRSERRRARRLRYDDEGLYEPDLQVYTCEAIRGGWWLLAASRSRPTLNVVSECYSGYPDCVSSDVLMEEVMSFLERVAKTQRGKPEAKETADPWMEEQCQAVMEYMTAREWPDGEERETSTLLLFVEDGVFKACLNDRENERGLWATSETLRGSIEALEARLRGGKADWRAWSGSSRNKRGKKGGK